jgi:hypothetical protein
MITTKRLKELLDYDPDTGDLVWKAARGGKNAGDLAGGITRDRGIVVTIDDVPCSATMIVWLMVKGRRPANRIRHLNGDKTDLSWDNLAVFKKKRKPARDRIDIGVEIHPRGIRLISFKERENVDLGTYKDLEQAIDVLRILI